MPVSSSSVMHQHDAGGRGPAAVGAAVELGAAQHAVAPEQRPQHPHRVPLQREPHRLVVSDDLLRQRHERQRDGRLLAQFAGLGGGEERQGLVVWQAAHGPERLAAVEPKRTEGVGIGEQPHRTARQIGPAHQFLDIGIAPAPPRRDAQPPFLAEAVDLAEAETQGEAGMDSRLQPIVPKAEIHVDRARLDAADLLRLAHDLGGCVEAHGLRVQKRAGEGRRVMAFQPGGDVDQLGEGGGVAFREAVAAEALDLVEAALGEIALIAARHHPLHHHVLIVANAAVAAENFAATMASFIACSWKSGTPLVLFSTWKSSSAGPCSGAGAG